MKRQFATAKWSFLEYLAFLRLSPAVQHAEWQPPIREEWRQTPLDELRRRHLERTLRFWNDLDTLKRVWGRPTKKRMLYWPLIMRHGFLAA